MAIDAPGGTTRTRARRRRRHRMREFAYLDAIEVPPHLRIHVKPWPTRPRLPVQVLTTVSTTDTALVHLYDSEWRALTISRDFTDREYAQVV